MGIRLRIALLASAFLACVPALSRAQQGFHAVFSKDGTDAWAVGDAGVYYRTLDGGLTWSSGSLGPSRLRDVSAVGLNVLMVGDSGKVWRSVNSGGAWALTVVSGTPELRAVARPSAQIGYVVGASGTILKSVDGGAVWTSQTSGTSSRLNAVRFTDDDHGWAVGEGGTVLTTSNGGASWTPVAVGTSNALYAIDQRGTWLWIVGATATALESVNGGISFAPVDLKLQDGGGDVRTVWLQSADSVVVAGGGGFIRRSGDRGRTWDFPVHTMHGQISDVCFAGGGVFASCNKNRIVMSSVDGGATWRFPNGAQQSRTWEAKQSFTGSTRGNSFGWNYVNRGTIYCALGNIVYRSLNEGDNWTAIATIPQCSKVNAFIVSPKDSNVWIAAVSGVIAKRLVKTDDYGVTWFTTLTHDFGEYGIPLEYDHDRPDTMYFGADYDRLHRSIDGGKNWEQWSLNTFRSPCDLVVVPDSGNVILLGDGITGSNSPPGQYYKSVDWGQNFTLIETRPSGSSEIPGMSNSRLRNSVTFGSNWGSGGVQRTTNFGASWQNVNPTASAWGTDIARDDPNVVIFGVYSGGQSYLSLDGGNTFLTSALGGSNYSFYLRDRGLILAEQSGGIYKMLFNYSYVPVTAQSVSVSAPNGGEVWQGGTLHDIRWNAANMALARIEYRTDPLSSWQFVAEVPGYQGRYAWTVPSDNTTQARVRVRDAWDLAPDDSSNADFTVQSTFVHVADPDGEEEWQYNTVHTITWSSGNISSVALEYRTAPTGSWKPIASGLPAAQGSYDWTIPFDMTSRARVRVRSEAGAELDISDADFRLTAPLFDTTHPQVWTALVLLGNVQSDSLRIFNRGTAPLAISSVTSDDPKFWPGRTSLVILPGSSDTVGVYFEPAAAGKDSAMFTVLTDDPYTPHQLLVTGEATTNAAVGTDAVTSFGLWQNRPNPFASHTLIRYALPVEADVDLEVFDLQGQRVATLVRGAQQPGVHSVSFGPGARTASGGRLENLPSGVYFYRFQAGSFASMRKMLLLR